MDTQFGTSTPYSLGIEEEFQLVDADTFELVSSIESILMRFDGETIEERVKPELLQSVVEVSTRIAASVEEGVDDLADLRGRLTRVAAEHGAAIASAGTHPFSRYEHQDVTDRPRYAELAESFGWLAARHPVFGLHVHVGVSSAAKAIACADGLRAHLPELLALSANSPFWHGRPTGLASTRAKILEDLPRAGLPPVLSSFAEFERIVEHGVRAGCFPDYTHIWWDVRPHPRFGTVEIRICDAQTHVANVAALAALVQSLVATLGSAFECGEVAPASPDIVLEENRRRAARYGLEARLIDLADDTERPATEAIRALVERCAPAADALGCAEELELVEQILVGGNGADEQLRVYDETGDVTAVARWVTEQTITAASRRRTSPRRRARARARGEQRAEALRLEQVPAAEPCLVELELGEDRRRFGVARLGRLPELGDEPVAQLAEARGGDEDATHDELRRHRAVPAVLLEPERDVVAALAPVRVEPRAEAEGDRAAGVGAVAADAEAQVLALPDRGEVAELAAGSEQRHAGVAEPERRQPGELGAEVERQPLAARDDRVDLASPAAGPPRRGRRGVLGERLGEAATFSGAIERPAAARWPPQRSSSAEQAPSPPCRSNAGDRAAGALPVALAAGDQHDRAVVPLDET